MTRTHDMIHVWHTLAQKILELHQLLDRALGDMMAEAGKDATVVLASDHGMGPLYKEVFLNNWLREQGYLVIKENPQTVTRYRQLMRSLGLTREGIWRVIGRARTQQFKQLLPRRLHGLVPTEHPTLANVVDWSKTKAYSMGNIGQIYINLAGREPFGIVNPGSEYDQVIDELKESLMTFCDPETGIPIVDYVYTKDELYDGHFKDRAPDLNIVMQNYGYVTQQRRELASDDLVRPIYSMSGFHRREGIFLAYGPFIQSGEYEPASIIDVTPTLLHLLGLPIPDDMDGQVMHDICTAPLADEESVRRIEIDALIDQNIDLQDEDEERMLHRLKDLGYLG
ncbi:alkaline phosphatase family protein [Chloroflexi bacterium TSY]|nr:alkaline phosphatase family protein [Chloroflexi bacterium TSY]